MTVSTLTELSSLDERVLNIKYVIRGIAGSKVRWYGLDNSILITEHVPLTIRARTEEERRIRPAGTIQQNH